MTGQRSPNRAVYVLVLVSGMVELACERHLELAGGAGGFGWPLSELPPVVWWEGARRPPAVVVEAARRKPPPPPVRGVHSRDARLAYSLGMRLLELLDEAGSGGSG
jgi:hypothetical protein